MAIKNFPSIADIKEHPERTFPDVSSYQGNINFDKLKKHYNHIIIRTTTKSGTVDKYMARNILEAVRTGFTMDFYKFMYAMDYDHAYHEMKRAIAQVKVVHPAALKEGIFFADLEKINGRTHTRAEAIDILYGAHDACKDENVQFGIYCNWDYLMQCRLIESDFKRFHYPVWLARYSASTGDFGEWNVIYWQYIACAETDGIKGYHDKNYVVKYSEISNRHKIGG